MLKSLRHHRWLAVLALIASPAFGGVVLPVVHSCPMAQQEMEAGVGHHDSHADHTQSHSHNNHQQCTCIGQCHTPSSAEIRVVAPTIAVTMVVPEPPEPQVPQTHPPVPFRVIDRLPPSHAPPLA